jgi:FMN-dependent NADH-azoreductase
MTILRLDSSITGEHSVSRTLTDAITAQLTAVSPGETLVVRDLVAAPLAHLTLPAFADTTVIDE